MMCGGGGVVGGGAESVWCRGLVCEPHCHGENGDCKRLLNVIVVHMTINSWILNLEIMILTHWLCFF